MKVPENHGKRKHGNNMKNKRQHRADEQFEIRQSKGNLMVTDETSDETDVNNLPVQGKPSVFPVCDFTFLSYSPYFLKICRNRNDSLKQQAKLCLCEDWLCWLRFLLKSKLTSFSCVLESRTFFLGKKGTHGRSQIKSIVEWDGLHHTTLCIQFLDRENNDKNITFPLGKQICFTIVWNCAEILPSLFIRICHVLNGSQGQTQSLFLVCNLRPGLETVKFNVRRSLEPFKDFDDHFDPSLTALTKRSLMVHVFETDYGREKVCCCVIQRYYCILLLLL